MIQQPELGKKISDLRKAKGLTQEELVEKCNLSVRTLQRIESGDVIPRTSTIKLIFKSLEVSFDEAMQVNSLANKHFEQFYKNFIDLFNLKTNTMKKLSILTLSLFLILFTVGSILNNVNANNNTEPNDIQASNSATVDSIMTAEYEITGMFKGWNNEDEFIGRDVDCIINGAVLIKTPLLKIDKQKNEIRTPCYSAIFIKNTIKILSMKCQPTKKNVTQITFSGDEFIYVGELIFSENESISAGKIIVPRN